MDAAEHDELRVRMLGDRAGELERIAGVIGEADDLVSLVVVPQNDDAREGAGGDEPR